VVRTGGRGPGAVAPRLVLALVVLLGLTVGMGYLLTRADEGDAFERVDRALVGWFAGRRTDTLSALSGPVAELGNTAVVVGIAVVVAVAAGLGFRSWRPVVLLAVALCGEVAIFLSTTAVIDRPRPPVQHLDDVLPPTSSFPSGHTAAAICLYGVIAVLVLVRTRGRGRALVVAAVVAVVAAVAAARLYRGAHYPTDLLGSVLFAVPWLIVSVRVLPLPTVARPRGVGEWRGD
jgi:undecaprenyl-diphosphatase